MDAMSPQRPHHRRNASSKSNILRSLVSSKARNEQPQIYSPPSQEVSHTQKVPILPPDYPHARSQRNGRVLGERQGNVQSPPPSPSKTRQKSMATSKTGNDLRHSNKDGSVPSKKSKSSTNLGAVFAKMNRSSKDLSAQAPGDKENTTPPSSANGHTACTPIWESLNTTEKKDAWQDGNLSKVEQEIARYTPQEYSPSKQRNFNGGYEQPRARPTMSKRPQSEYFEGTSYLTGMGERGNGDVGRKSMDIERRKQRTSVDDVTSVRDFATRKASGSSTEEPAKEKLNVAKRGGRVMAAVAAFQGKGKEQQVKQKELPALDRKAIEKAFEEVLASRNVPETTRQKMRSMTLTVKADFIEKNQGLSSSSPTDGPKARSATNFGKPSSPAEDKAEDDESKATKRSRPRSRTFTFSKGDKKGETSPSKKRRSQSRNRQSVHEDPVTVPATPHKSPRSSLDKSAPAIPADFIAYLRKHQQPAKAEIGRMHKLRILLRNETVAWVDSFLALGGMTEIVGLLHRVMAVEWREEHEDNLLHETLNCLRALCTTEKAMGELDLVADELFPALMAMLFDEEKKGPAEYATRTIITTVLFNYLAAATNTNTTTTSSSLEHRARKIFTYLSEPSQPASDRPVDFVLHMRAARPYKLWSREVTNVTREVFWIFLHHLNVVPLPRPTTNSDADIDADPVERAKALEATYATRHFPGSRPPVPAAPYIGGVEWDATTYLTSHLDLLNGLVASLPSAGARNSLRAELQASGFEKVMGGTLRTCKEKFYAGVHDALRVWVAAAVEDGWEVRFVREGPTREEEGAMALRARSASPKKKAKGEEAPKLDVLPALNLHIGSEGRKGEDEGWLG